MSRKVIFFIFLLATALALTSCDVTCDPGSLVQPDLVSPDWREVVDGSAAVLEWSYPDTCDPEEFEIILSKDREYAVIEHTELVPGDSTTLTAPTLDIAEEYWWRVRAKVDSSYGGYSGERRSFFTLPSCTAGDLVAPSLVSPAYGGIYDNAYDSLEWEWPLTTCIPESYRVEVSMDSLFIDTTYNGGTGTPGTRWGFGSTPPDATQFWWRISAFADGAYGPPSIAYSFFTPPVCTGASLIQAVPLTPLNNEFVPAGNPEFTWTYPDSSCVPEGYHLRIYQPWDWTYTVMEADSPDAFSLSFQAGVPVPDCADYMWQITMISEGVEGPLNIGQRFIVDSGSCDCALGSIPIPILDRPTPYEILPDTNAHINWHAPGGCFPEGASLKISPDYDFADTSRDVMLSGPFPNTFDPPGLEPATQYWWKVAYFEDDGGSPVLGDYSGPRSFFTGPECAAIGDVMAPEIYAPLDGEVVNTLTPALRYRPGAPGCIPDGYFLNLQIDPAFGGTNLLGGFSLPGTTVFPDPLTDCTEYFLKVNGIQDGAMGPESDVISFVVDVDGTCGLGGVPGTAKSNFFCREGTFEVFDPLWTVENGHRVLAIARNPLTTYLQLTILDQETKQPFKHQIKCWGYIGNIELGWPETPEGRQYSFDDLPVKKPPPTPIPVPEEKPVCHLKLNAKDCKASGGTYDTNKNVCQCP